MPKGTHVIVVDVLLIAVLIAALATGIARGLVASAGSLVGLVIGGAAAFWLVPIVNDAWPWQQWRPLVLVALIVLLVGGLTALGGAVGAALRKGVDRTRLRGIDRLLGGVLSVIVAALAISLVGSSVAVTGMPMISAAVGSSQVMRAIDRVTPAPVSAGLAQLRSFVLDDGLPQLGDLLEIEVRPTAPPVDLTDPELAEAAASIAQVSGTAYACGVTSTGTGFVVSNDRVVTNAHVVAGVDTPVVQLPGGIAREGRIVYFDPVDDLAVIAVEGLEADPLVLGETVGAGTQGVIQGYPYGGPFTTVSAAVVSVGSVPVPDIHGATTNPREIYALQAAVRPGNSGGPLLTGDGVVVGVVFARAETDDTRGYAMTMAELDPVAAQAPSLSQAVSSGSCAA